MTKLDERHTLGEYTQLLKSRGLLSSVDLKGKENTKIEYISFNSSDVASNTLFVCKGVHFEERYLEAAMANGGVCYVSEKKYDELTDVPSIIVNDIRNAMALIANYFYNNVSEHLKILGVTGTKGKSTTTFFVKNIMDEYMKELKKPLPAHLSSIRVYDGVSDEPSRITTPEAFDVLRHLNNAYESGIEWVVMEVSSQALKYKRVEGLSYVAGCFTNIGEDHISPVEHPSFEDYFETKLMLFDRSETAILDLNAEKADLILKEAKKRSKNVITFGTVAEADVYAYDIRQEGETISFMVRTKDFDEEFKINMWGLFNVYNALAAIALSMTAGASKESIRKGLYETEVEGRVKLYSPKNKKLNIIVDYAHNKMSFKTLAEAAREAYPGSMISVVFGAPGNKAFGRRKDLGEIAGRYCDYAYITEDDPGEESPVDICNEISKYVEKEGGKYSVIIDRREAIRKAILETEENGVVLVIGKGNETSQKRGTVYVDTPSDGEYVLDILKSEKL